MYKCPQCHFVFKLCDRLMSSSYDEVNIIVECPRCHGQIVFDYIKTIPVEEEEK